MQRTSVLPDSFPTRANTVLNRQHLKFQANGTCQIEVTVGDVVAVPEGYGLGPIEITAITAAAVEMFAPLTGSGYSISGCSGGGGVSSQGGGGVRMSCKAGTVATINDVMKLEIVEIGATTAILRIKPAG
jgi:hypothetical protein